MSEYNEYSTYEHMTTEVQAFMGLVDGYLVYEDRNGEPRGHEIYHPSAFGKCLRLMQYQRYSERGYIPTPDDPHAPFLCRIFGNGHSMHDRWKGYLEDIGILRGYWTCKNILCGAFDDSGNYDNKTTINQIMQDVPAWSKKRRRYGTDQLIGCFKPEKCVCGWTKFRYDEVDVISKELNFHGHADGVLDFQSPHFNIDKYVKYFGKNAWNIDSFPKKPIVIDFKTINTDDFQEVAKGNPGKDYIVQLTIYANILDCEYGLLLYENKNNQRTTGFKVLKNENTLWPLICRQADLMNQMTEVEDDEGNVHHLLPPPKYSSRESKGCTYCIYKDECHVSAIWDAPDFDEQRQEFYGELL